MDKPDLKLILRVPEIQRYTNLSPEEVGLLFDKPTDIGTIVNKLSKISRARAYRKKEIAKKGSADSKAIANTFGVNQAFLARPLTPKVEGLYQEYYFVSQQVSEILKEDPRVGENLQKDSKLTSVWQARGNYAMPGEDMRFGPVKFTQAERIINWIIDSGFQTTDLGGVLKNSLYLEEGNKIIGMHQILDIFHLSQNSRFTFSGGVEAGAYPEPRFKMGPPFPNLWTRWDLEAYLDQKEKEAREEQERGEI